MWCLLGSAGSLFNRQGERLDSLRGWTVENTPENIELATLLITPRDLCMQWIPVTETKQRQVERERVSSIILGQGGGGTGSISTTMDV